MTVVRVFESEIPGWQVCSVILHCLLLKLSGSKSLWRINDRGLMNLWSGVRGEQRSEGGIYFFVKAFLSLKDSVFGVSTAVMLTEIFIYFPFEAVGKDFDF